MPLPRLDSDWKSLRAKPLQRRWNPQPLQPYLDWFMELGEPGQLRVMPVLGPSKAHRGQVYRALAKDVMDVGDILYEVKPAHPFLDSLVVSTDAAFGAYGLAWELVTTRSLSIAHPLWDLVDQDLLASDTFRLLWEMRFLLREQPGGEAARDWLGTFKRWMLADGLTMGDVARLEQTSVLSRPSMFEERMAIFNLLLGLAFQNGVYDRAVILLDGVDDPAYPCAEALAITRSMDAWTVYGRLPVGFLAGLDLEKAQEMLLTNPDFAGVVLG
jgi:hypothetical protein